MPDNNNDENFIYRLSNGVGNSSSGGQYDNTQTQQLTEDDVNGIIGANLRTQTERQVFAAGSQQSQNFVTGSSGWKIDSEGNAEFNNGTFRGTFIIGGALITVSDIANLQPALDALVLLGGGTVALVPNTYNVTQSYTIPSNVTIDGNGATIDFGGGAYQFNAVGTNAYSIGTLSVNLNSTSVTGSGTTWTAGMVGQSILIGDSWYEITARSSNTAITLGSPFIDASVSGATYVIATTVGGLKLQNITLQNSSTTLLNLRYVDGVIIDGLSLYNAPLGFNAQDSANINGFNNSGIDSCTAGLSWNNVPNSQIVNSSFSNITGGTAISWTKVNNASISVFYCQNITGVGIKLTNCYNMGIDAGSIIGCTSNGIELVSGNTDIDIITQYISTCGGDGIKFTASSNRVEMVANNIINNTGYGINIADSTSSNNQIIAPAFSNNTSGNINDLGTNTFISPQTLISFSNQDVILSTDSGAPDNVTTMITSNTDGSVLFLGQALQGTTLTIYRLQKDLKSNYSVTHSTTLTITSGNSNGMCVVGNQLYVSVSIAGVSSLRRYSTTDLSGVTTVTFSGTSRRGNMFSDGTNLYIFNGTTDQFDKFTISGTVATNNSTKTYTSSRPSGDNSAGVICDGTNVWICSGVTGGSMSVRKYPIAGGAATSTTTRIIITAALYQNTTSAGIGLFLGDTQTLGIGWYFSTLNPTTALGLCVRLIGIALP